MGQKEMLCNKSYALRDRLRLFEATVTKAALYGSETWVSTVQLRNRLSTTQRKMLRWMMGTKRRVERVGESEDGTNSENSEPISEEDTFGGENAGVQLESWEEWVKRATAAAESELLNMNIEDWNRQRKRNRWRWAGRITRCSDVRWTLRMLSLGACRWTPAGRKTEQALERRHR